MQIDPKTVQWDAPDPASIKWDAPASPQSFGANVKRATYGGVGGVLSGVAGTRRGIKDAFDTGADWLSSGFDKLAGTSENARVKAMNEAGTKSYDAQHGDSTTAKVMRVGGQIGVTLPVGGVFAAPIKALAGAGVAPRVLAPVADAIATSGMRAGGMNGLSGVGVRAAGGGITGGAAAGVVNPGDAGTGAAIGAALPPGLKAAGMVGSAVSGTVKHGLGMSTGVGAESIAQAYKAGKTGSKDFLNNMRGDVPLTDVLDRAKQGLEAMRVEKSAQYRSGMVPIGKDQSVLKFDGIDKALTDAAGITGFKGQVKNVSAAGAVGKMREVVDEWRALDPQQFHTPEGLDALKQKLGGILESIPFEEKTARLAAGKVYNATKASIEQQAPTYAKVMGDYSAASQQVTEIERALSLKPNSSQDTAMRKLQSLMRNNVQTNYGGRLANASSLEAQGGVELMPSIAGQALNSWTPRSLTGQLGGGATAFASMANPAMVGLLPFQSPRMVGSMAYGAGRAANALTPQNPNALAQFGYRAAPILGGSR